MVCRWNAKGIQVNRGVEHPEFSHCNRLNIMGQFPGKLAPEYFLCFTAPKRLNHTDDSIVSRYYRQALSFFWRTLSLRGFSNRRFEKYPSANGSMLSILLYRPRFLISCLILPKRCRDYLTQSSKNTASAKDQLVSVQDMDLASWSDLGFAEAH